MFQSQHFAALLIDRVMEGATLPDAMDQLSFDRVPPTAKPFVMELTWGTLRQWGLCSSLADSLAARHVSPTALRALLSVAIFQLMFMNQPAFAVVDQAVEATAKINAFAKSFTNALLRRFLREKEKVLSKIGERPLAKYSYPRWWIDQMRAAYPDDFSEILLAQNTPPPITLRINRRQCRRAQYLDVLAKAQIPAEPIGEEGVMLDAATPVTTLPFFAEGYFSVQDAGAQHAARLLELKDGQRVLDAAAAPGGKATHILETANVFLTAVDNDKKRMARVVENVARLGLDHDLSPITYHVADASQPDTWWDGQRFDRVLLDAPCSASGVVRRHPDAKWLRREEDVVRFAAQQRLLLDRLWSVLSPSGKLLYVTCSLFPTENEQVVVDFLSHHQNARREAVTFESTLSHRGGQLLPVSGKTFNQDALFYALFTKTS
ncbi:MAG: 16S rRNA (cytosine(967)-C(5))-methyltransferase RsmB [Burkholderiales bacterium]|jgi:16S rRNA (cytosine967-C5)-methyltransferase|nr:16S rRNA (cytosine(967)-C(5))-methyltransferase RsmB [Burkholderiales bacterium]